MGQIGPICPICPILPIGPIRPIGPILQRGGSALDKRPGSRNSLDNNQPVYDVLTLNRIVGNL